MHQSLAGRPVEKVAGDTVARILLKNHTSSFPYEHPLVLPQFMHRYHGPLRAIIAPQSRLLDVSTSHWGWRLHGRVCHACLTIDFCRLPTAYCLLSFYEHPLVLPQFIQR